MQQTQSVIPSLIAGALVFGSLGLSGVVGTVATMADDRVPAASAPQGDNAAPLNAIPSVIRASKASRETDLSTSRQTLSVRLSKDGMISGRLGVVDSITGSQVAAEKLNIKFIRRGSVVSEAKPGPGGVFHASGMTPGVYTMMAKGEDGLFACALLVSPYAGDSIVSAQDPLQIDSMVVHPSNVAAVRKLMASSMSPAAKATDAAGKSASKNRVSTSAVSLRREDEEPAPLQTPVLTVGPQGKVLINVNELDPATGERRPASGAVVYLVQRGVVRGRFNVEEGAFYAPGLVGGRYSMFVTSPSSDAFSLSSQPLLAAMGVIVEESGAGNNTVNKNSSRFLVQQVRASKLQGTTGVDLTPSTDFQQGDGQTQGGGQQPAPVADGGAGAGGGTGGGGGGFGGGGGGGLGGLAALGAIGAIAAVAATRNNNNPSSPSK